MSDSDPVLLIVDIEATCWEGDPPPDESNEIIEIGICTLNLETGAISEAESILVRPVRSRVSEFCTTLTTLTQEQVDGGIYFPEACDLLREKYASATRTWASWGNYDKRMFEEQCALWSIEYPFSKAHINLKNRYSKLTRTQRLGMVNALAALELPLIGTHHRGSDDAYNIARITAHLLEKHGAKKLL